MTSRHLAGVVSVTAFIESGLFSIHTKGSIDEIGRP